MIYTIFVSFFEKILIMKNHIILYLGLIIVTLASSCSKNLSVNKRRYSDGYYVSISDKKKTKEHDLETSFKKDEIKVVTQETITNSSYLYKISKEKDVSKEKNAVHAQLKPTPVLKSKSASNSLPLVKHQEKEFNTALNFVKPHKTKRTNHQSSLPFNGYFFDQGSNVWFAIGGIIAFIVTIVFFILVISAIGAITFSFPFIFPLLLIIGLIILLTVGVLVLLNAS